MTKSETLKAQVDEYFKEHRICRHYNKGHCKLKQTCFFVYPKEKCHMGRCVFKGKCALMHKDPSCQMTVVDKLLKELKQEVSKLKSDIQEAKGEVTTLKQEKSDTIKTFKEDVLQVQGVS